SLSSLLAPHFFLFFLRLLPTPRSSLFPYTTLFRSKELKKAITYVRKNLGFKRIIVQEFISGDEVRIYVLNNKVIAAANRVPAHIDRKSTRLNSSHVSISYAVFCLKTKKRRKIPAIT